MKSPRLIFKKQREFAEIQNYYNIHGKEWIINETILRSWNRKLVSETLEVPYRTLMKLLRQRREGNKLW